MTQPTQKVILLQKELPENEESKNLYTQSYVFAPKQTVQRAKTIAKTHQINKQLVIEPETYKYYIGPGNNSHLVRKIMSTRKQWQEVTDSKNLSLSFKWQQSNRGYIYENSTPKKPVRQVLNHFEYHQQISNKQYLFKNILQFCELNKINAFEFLPVTFILNTLDNNFEGQESQFLNFYHQVSPPPLNFKPKTMLHIIKRPIRNTAFYIDKKIHTVYTKYEVKQCYRAPNSKALWILKPTFYNRGNGVHVFSTIEELESLMTKYIKGESEQAKFSQTATLPKKPLGLTQGGGLIIQSTSFVIQKYMQNPLLFNGRKFDIRVWVLFTHQLKVYLFRQGYVRTSSFPYTTGEEKISDLSVHLTNNAVQKHNQNYCKFQSGNQLSFKTLRTMIEAKGKKFDQFIGRMKELIRISALSVKRRINKMERSSCFEIFGYDFMVDDIECKPWLIEVNTNPCLEQSSGLLEQLIPRMLDDAFSLTLDKMFPSSKTIYSYVVENELNSENLWDFLIDLKKN